MTDEPSRPHPGPLTDLQRDRMRFARYDLATARAENLGQHDIADLIFIIERLRSRLHDMIDLVEELSPPAHGQPDKRVP
ncbi:hypothetical protein [Streptomyces sp. NPDC051016]|uniref:hypothetical protein n=1 Tax=Streptomyces sp. NPDC051016 TaxID=3365638 RepID=UPI0037BDBA4A